MFCKYVLQYMIAWYMENVDLEWYACEEAN